MPPQQRAHLFLNVDDDGGLSSSSVRRWFSRRSFWFSSSWGLYLDFGPRLCGVNPLRMPACRSLRHVTRWDERKTVSKRMRSKLLEIKQQLRRRMHEPVARTGKWLRSVVQGYFNYYAVPGKSDSLAIFRSRVIRLWRSMLIYRGGKRNLTWAQMIKLVGRWIPSPRILHPYPRLRFDAIHPR